jgi:hypothetical protein
MNFQKSLLFSEQIFWWKKKKKKNYCKPSSLQIRKPKAKGYTYMHKLNNKPLICIHCEAVITSTWGSADSQFRQKVLIYNACINTDQKNWPMDGGRSRSLASSYILICSFFFCFFNSLSRRVLITLILLKQRKASTDVRILVLINCSWRRSYGPQVLLQAHLF